MCVTASYVFSKEIKGTIKHRYKHTNSNLQRWKKIGGRHLCKTDSGILHISCSLEKSFFLMGCIMLKQKSTLLIYVVYRVYVNPVMEWNMKLYDGLEIFRALYITDPKCAAIGNGCFLAEPGCVR